MQFETFLKSKVSWWWTCEDEERCTVYDCGIECDNVFVFTLDSKMITELTDLYVVDECGTFFEENEDEIYIENADLPEI